MPSSPCGPLPFFIGVTGHRDLRPADIEALEASVRSELRHSQAARPHSRLCLMSSLAAGADVLAARVALEEGALLWAVLPMEPAQYARDFSPQEQAYFDSLLARAQKILVVGTLEPGQEEDTEARAEAYARAGAHVAACCDWMLALWDGSDNGKLGGTADVVRYRLQGAPPALMPPRDPLDAPETGPACHIFTPRQPTPHAENTPERPQVLEASPGHRKVLWPHASEIGHHAHDEAVRDEWNRARARADEFNRDALVLGPSLSAAREQSRGYILPPCDQARLSPEGREMLEAYALADALALHFSALTQRTMRRLFAWMFVAAACFNLFDALPLSQALSPRLPPNLAQAPWFLLLSLGVSAYCTGALYGPARRGDFQNKHQDYRALAEGLRVQFFWALSGLPEPAADHYMAKQKGELSWIQHALRFHHARMAAPDSILEVAPGQAAGTAAGTAREGLKLAQKRWVEDQRDYFVRKARSEHAGLEHDEHLITVLLSISGVLAIALCLALGAPALLPWPILAQVRDALSGDWAKAGMMMSIVLLALSAGLLHGYNQQRARAEHAKQFGRMSLIFGTAASRLHDLLPDVSEAPEEPGAQEPLSEARQANARRLLLSLGREALNENGDWVQLHRERPLEVPRAG